MSREELNVPGEKPVPSDLSLTIQIVVLTLAMLGYVAFTLFLSWAGFFPDVTKIM